jgi:hypothetical protein
MQMNLPFLIASLVCVVAAVIHGVAGERTNIRVLAHTEMQPTLKLELRAVWHIVTVHLAASAVMLLLLAIAVQPQVLIGQLIVAQFFVYGLGWVGLAALSKIGLLKAPQWVLLLAIAGLTYWGTRLIA